MPYEQPRRGEMSIEKTDPPRPSPVGAKCLSRKKIVQSLAYYSKINRSALAFYVHNLRIQMERHNTIPPIAIIF